MVVYLSASMSNQLYLEHRHKVVTTENFIIATKDGKILLITLR